KDRNGGVRRQAAPALGRIDPEAKGLVAALTDALKDKDERVRRGAASSLGQIGAAADAAVPVLIDALKDEDQAVRTRAAEALKKIDPEAARKAGVALPKKGVWNFEALKTPAF